LLGSEEWKMEILAGAIIGTAIGIIFSQISLLLFGDEIINWIENTIKKVRKFYNLPT
jgi:hypothetical protein